MAVHFTKTVWWKETLLLLQLAVPSALLELGFIVPYFVSASFIGRTYGAVYLSGFQLANLTSNLFTMSLIYGLYSACDTLAPQAFGAHNYREVGVLAIRGFLSTIIIILPLAVLTLVFIEPVLVAFGEDEEASELASTWYGIYVICYPFYAIFLAIWTFLLAQEIMMPLLITEAANVLIVLPLAMWFWTHYFGYAGSAAACVTYEIAGTVFIMLYLYFNKRSYRQRCWPGFAEGFKEAVSSWKAIKLYLFLGGGGILASSEWVYWEMLSLLVGRLGVVPLAIHTIPTQVVTLAFLVPEGIGIGLATRLAILLPQDFRLAKQVAFWTVVVSSVFFGIMSYVMYIYRFTIFRMFVFEEDVIEGCDRIWLKVCFMFFQWAICGLVDGIATALGMQWTLAWITIVSLWFVGMPGAWYFGIYKHQSIDVVWNWLIPPYALMNVALIASFYIQDWERISEDIRIREEAAESSSDDESSSSSSDDESDSEGEKENGKPEGYGATETTALIDGKDHK